MRGLDPRIHAGDPCGRMFSNAPWIAGTSPRLSGLILVDEAHGMDSSGF
jgi:hypothetical protein